jgi:TldD protein
VTTRRNFLKASSLAAIAGVSLPDLLAAQRPSSFSTPIDVHPRAGDPQLRELAMRALDAAKRAGATYADVRLTVTRQQAFYYANPPIESETIAVGVRALANGAWGFVASADWTPDVMERLGREATAQAKGNAWRNAPPIELGERPTPATGTWAMPVKREPFSVAVEEKLDYIRSAEAYARTFRNCSASSVIVFERQERTFASTDGAFCTQTVYNSLGNRSFFSVGVVDPVTRRSGGRGAEFVSPTGAGYEIFEDAKLLDQIPRLYEEARRMLVAEPINPSRYDLVLDGYAMASIVDETIGAALEIDRALGYEANASGTSYLAPIEKILGTRLGTSILNVSANRSHPTAAATVKWDDDGVEPDEFALIKDGVVVDYATSRQHTKTLESWYTSRNTPVRSHGCAASEDGMSIPIVHTPNIVMHAGAKNLSFEELVATVDDGIAVLGGRSLTDQQKLNGQGMPAMMYRIRKGKFAEVLSNGGFWFRSPDFWKDLVAVGGEKSAVSRGFTTEKGQPQQNTVHSVRAVAAHFKNVRVIDIAARNMMSGSSGHESILR